MKHRNIKMIISYPVAAAMLICTFVFLGAAFAKTNVSTESGPENALSGGSVIAFAAQNNALTAACEHDYKIVTLERNGDIILMCDKCNNRITTTFSAHLNERSYPPLDVVADGVVNAKDYAYIYAHYLNDDWGGEIVPPIF